MPLHSNSVEKAIDHPILKKLPQEIRKEIVRRAEFKKFPAGHVVCRQGDPGDSFFMIKSGKVRIYRKSKENKITELAILKSGDSFGEMALLTGSPRSAHVVVIEDVELTSLSKDQFDRILKNYPVVSLTLIKQMASWLIENDKILEREHHRQYKASKISVFDFLIIFLLSGLCALIFNQSNPGGIKLFPHMELNENIRMIPPSVAFKEMEDASIRFVDALPSDMYEKKHIRGAINIPLSVFDIMYMMGLSDAEKSQKIIVYGRTISRRYDIQLANKLYRRGHKNIQVLEGGLPLWRKKEYPTAP